LDSIDRISLKGHNRSAKLDFWQKETSFCSWITYKLSNKQEHRHARSFRILKARTYNWTCSHDRNRLKIRSRYRQVLSWTWCWWVWIKDKRRWKENLIWKWEKNYSVKDRENMGAWTWILLDSVDDWKYSKVFVVGKVKILKLKEGRVRRW